MPGRSSCIGVPDSLITGCAKLRKKAESTNFCPQKGSHPSIIISWNAGGRKEIAVKTWVAEWIDETPAENIESYSLRVYSAGDVEEIDSIDGNQYYSKYYGHITLSEPWGGAAVSGGRGEVYFGHGFWGVGFDGYITYTVPDGYHDRTFSVQVTTTTGNNGDGSLTKERSMVSRR